MLVLTKFKVWPGDTITVMVYFDSSAPSGDGDNSGGSSSDGPELKAHAMFVNESKATYTSFAYTYAAQDTSHAFRGNTAEWILEGHDNTQVPDYGATSMYNCLATTEMGEERDLDNAALIDMVRDGKHVSTPVKVTSNTLGLFWGEGKLLAHQAEGR
ncbi:hypothetical protein O1611_g3152 [Lasiodiplodia mahajangana]|uniref:Uncharacterized protein n=1 Tax=Lasiodiplodia mahajangana TaxID=1108764 RepID=A0ACC2JTF7_9PEZI|nr:hypothetical protein O1611_g3152 [Lasiodiplodia mahajangana]